MTSATFSLFGPRADGRSARWLTLPARHPVVAVCILTLLLALCVHAPFVGGDGDEYQYLTAARCAADHGFCLPQDHWWRRHPIVLPAGVALRLFGESQTSLMLGPLGYGLAAVGLFTALIARQFGRLEGLIAGIALATTPAFGTRVPELNIDIPEFAFVLAALFCLQTAVRRDRISWVIACGAMLGLAVQARPTSLVLLPVILAGCVALNRLRWVAPLSVGVALPNLAELLFYAARWGNPFLPWRLSLAHNAVPSSALMPGVDTHRSPLFNPDYIAGWYRAHDVHVHWLVDGLLNLLVDPAIALVMVCAMIFIVKDRRALRREPVLIGALIGSAVMFAGLTYGFAINPEARMFIPIIATFCACFGVLAERSLPDGRLLVGVALALMIAKGVIASNDRADLTAAVTVAPDWIARQEGLVIEPRTRRFLALSPGVRTLHERPIESAQRLLLIGQRSCDAAMRDTGIRGWRTMRSQSVAAPDPAPIAALRRARLFLAPPVEPVMCLLRPA